MNINFPEKKTIEEGFDSVRSIDKYDYKDFDDLEVMDMGRDVHWLGTQLFRYTRKLREINVHPDNPFFSSEDGVLFNKNKTSLICFPQAKCGLSYTVPDSVRSIEDFAFSSSGLSQVNLNCTERLGDCAFEGNAHLTAIHFPKTLLSIGYVCFQGCNAIRNMFIPASVLEIQFPALPHSMDTVDISPDNKNYTVQDGIIFTKDMKKLCFCPSEKSMERYIIPDSVKEIAGSAFSFSQIESILIPKSVEHICRFAFSFMKSSQTVEIPAQLFEDMKENTTALSKAAFVTYM